MATELTIQLDDKLADQLRQISEKKGITISKLVSDYVKQLDIDALNDEFELTPIVKSLMGVLKGANVDEQDYQNFLAEKYL